MMTDDATGAWNAIKLIHSSDLREMRRLPSYQDYLGLTYHEYLVQRARHRDLRKSAESLASARRRLQATDHKGMVVYHRARFIVPTSLLGEWLTFPLDESLPETLITCDDGQIEGQMLAVKAGWKKKEVAIEYACPSRVLHAYEILDVKRLLDGYYEQPVLFVSHRWGSPEHPDPEGRQLERLKKLERCFVVYDYTSFPQKAASPEDDAKGLDAILRHMNDLVSNVVILASPDYLERGWCMYEYIASALKRSVVCDELQEEDYVLLRDWASTNPPAPENPFRDGPESAEQNYIAEEILKQVNKVLPKFAASKFAVPSDRDVVRRLLIDLLKRALPTRRVGRDYPESLVNREWKHEDWTDDELEAGFSAPLKWKFFSTRPTQRYNANVPKCIEDAVIREYQIGEQPIEETFRYVTRRARELEAESDVPTPSEGDGGESS
jgi:hypothetical protein